MSTSRIHLLTREEASHFFKKYPYLRGMWDEYCSIPFLKYYLRSKADKSVTNWGRDKVRSGEVFVVLLGEKPIGVTGWWQDPLCYPETIKMRWTAIHKDFRGRGYAEATIDQLAAHLNATIPGAKYLSESCPRHIKRLQKWFQRKGFTQWEDPDSDGLGIRLAPTLSFRRPLLK